MTEELSRFFEVDKINQSLKILYGIEDTSTIKSEIKDKKGNERIKVITNFYKKRLLEVGTLYTLNFDIQRENQNNLIKEVNKLKEAKEKINILFIASNPDIEFIDDDGNTIQQQKLKLEKEAREIHGSI